MLCIAMLGIGSIASKAAFGASNPLATLSALAQVVLFDAEYVEARDYPRAIIASPEASLEEYMASEGYVETEEDRMGAIRVFAIAPSSGFLEYVEHTVNGRYSLWAWHE